MGLRARGLAGGGDDPRIGFADPDAAGAWRRILQADPLTDDAGGASRARPAHETAPLLPDGTPTSGDALLEPSGAAYVDLDVRDPNATLDEVVLQFDIDVSDAAVHASVLLYDQYPRLCADPVDVPTGEVFELTLPAGCSGATLVLVNASEPEDRPLVSVDAAHVSYRAAVTGAEVCTPDPRGDLQGRQVSADFVDLVEYCVQYDDALTLSLTTAARAEDDDADRIRFTFEIDTDGGATYEGEFLLEASRVVPSKLWKWALGPRDGDVTCDGDAEYVGATLVITTISADCFGSPDEVLVGLTSDYMNSFGDFNLDLTAYPPTTRVRRGGLR